MDTLQESSERSFIPKIEDFDEFDTVVELIELGLGAPRQLADRLNASYEEIRHYLDLAEWLGFVDQGVSELTESGRRYVGAIEQRHRIRRETLERRSVIRELEEAPDWPEAPTDAAEAVIGRRANLESGEIRERARRLVELMDAVSLLDRARAERETLTLPGLPATGDLPVGVLARTVEEQEWLEAFGPEFVDELADLDLDAGREGLAEADLGADQVRDLIDRARRVADREVGDYDAVARTLREDDWMLSSDWREVFVALPTRARSSFEEAGVETVGEVLVTTDSIDLTDLPGVGETTARAVVSQIEVIEQRGYEVYLYGPSGQPQTVSELAARMLNALNDENRQLMRMRFLEGRTFKEIGDVFGLTRQRMRQKTDTCLERLRGHYGQVAAELVGPLVEELDEGAGLIHRSRVERWTGCPDLFENLLAARLIDDRPYLWKRDFIAARPSTTLERGPLTEVRRAISETRRMHVPLREVVDIATQLGVGIGFDGARDLVESEWALECDRRGRFRNPWINKGDRVAQVLLEAREPLELDTIAERYAESHATDDEAEPTARRVQPFVKKHPHTYTVDNGVYVHEVALPLDRQLLSDVTDWCIDRIRGKRSPVSVNVLLEQLQSSEWAVGDHLEELNPYLLRDVLLRREGTVGFHNTFNVAWEQTYENEGMTLLDRVERILREADEPMAANEVVGALPEEFEANPHSVENYLTSRPFSIALGESGYMHRDGLAFSDEELETILERVVEQIEQGAGVVSARHLVGELPEGEPFRRFASRERAAEELWGLLRHDDRVRTGRDLLVAREAGRSGDLLERAIRNRFEEGGPAYPRGIVSWLDERFETDISDSRVHRRLREMREEGSVRRLPNGMYYSPGDVDMLVDSFEERAEVLERELREEGFDDCETPALWALGRAFDRSDRAEAARRALEALRDRDAEDEFGEAFDELSERVDKQAGGAS